MSAFLRKIARRNGTNVDQLLLPFQVIIVTIQSNQVTSTTY